MLKTKMTIEVDPQNMHQGLRLFDVAMAFGCIKGFKHHHFRSKNGFPFDWPKNHQNLMVFHIGFLWNWNAWIFQVRWSFAQMIIMMKQSINILGGIPKIYVSRVSKSLIQNQSWRHFVSSNHVENKNDYWSRSPEHASGSSFVWCRYGFRVHEGFQTSSF